MTQAFDLLILAFMARNTFGGLTRVGIIVAVAASTACDVDVAALRLVPPALLDAPRWITIDAGREYARPDDKPLQFDLYRPTWIASPLPLAILVHGGSWRSGSRGDMEEFAYDIAAQGFAAASIDYRLVSSTVTFPKPVADVLASVRYFREHAADMQIDPDRIALLGISAGGNLVLLAGMTNDTSVFDPQRPVGENPGIRCIVDLEGPTDFTVDAADADPAQVQRVLRYLGLTQDNPDLAVRAAASPIRYVRSDGPPILIIHGTADTLVPITQSESFVDVLGSVGQPHQFIEIPGMGHVDGGLWIGPWVQLYRLPMFGFLYSNL